MSMAETTSEPASHGAGVPEDPEHPDYQRHLLLDRRGHAPLPRPQDAVLSVHGLAPAAVAEREEKGLVNRQPRDTSRSLWTILRVHILTLFNLTIAACAVAIIVLGRWFDLVFCLAAVANVVIGVIQEYSAKRKLDAIALLHQDAAHVLRDGTEHAVRLEEIVLDDAVMLRRGDQVPADGVVLSSDGLDIDESLLTGEADAVGKRTGDAVLSGSAVLSGTGLIRVTAVGPDSHASRLAIEARRYSKIPSELRGALDTVATWLTIALVPIAALIVNGQVQAVGGWALALEQDAIEPAVVASVAAITSMIPQGLALMTTISFAVAALKLARQEVLIQEQPAVEILARVDTVCLDKTGTLTEGRIVFDGSTDLISATQGGQPDESTQPGPAGAADLADLRSAGALVLGWFGADPNANPTALALAEAYPSRPPVAPTEQVAFASERRWSAVAFGPASVHDAGASGHFPSGDAVHGAWVLGAPEVLLPASGGGIDAERRAHIEALCDETTSRGLRTMVLCRSTEPAGVGTWFGTDRHLPPVLEAVALLTFREKVRDDARETLEYFRAQDVALKVISGDHPRTVAAVAREVGMEVEGDGYDARNLPSDPEERRVVLQEHSVFGRVSPEQKKGMVSALQQDGHVVAMTGDGINDALALKRADLGIAMGNGAPATKAVSRMVLLDSRFSRLPSVLAEGRQVIANMEQLAHMYLTKTAYAVLFGVVFSLLAWQYPLLPRQASTVDFLMIGLPTFFLTLVPNQRRYVPGFLGRALRFAIPSGLVILAGLLAVNGYARWFAGYSDEVTGLAGAVGTVSLQQVQTASVITLTLMGLWVLNLISRPLTRWKLALIVAMYALLLLVLLIPASREFHQFEIPPWDLTVAAVAIGAVACVLLEGIHQFHRRRHSGSGTSP
ncbi:HAD-IC family P-type ATPase [Citricoccus sp.]|uniref:HAD-IC family P-type ATPase n=1 Tax=Citricoccus sp. TaxID=1978372 RepID=UPI0037BE7B9F